MLASSTILSITHDAHRAVHSLIGAWMNGVHRTCAEMAAASCGTSHAPTNSAVSTPFQWILKIWAIKQVTCSESHMTWTQRACSRAETREQHYTKVINNNIYAAQNLVWRDYCKCIHAQIYTQAPAHKSMLTIQKIIHSQIKQITNRDLWQGKR